MEQFTITGNECFSVLVRDGGLAHLRSGTVNGTKCFQDKFGHNLAAIRRGKLEVHNFATSNAESCGLALDDGYLKLGNGEVKNNTIGLCVISVPSEGFNYYTDACLGGDLVQYINNQTKVSRADMVIDIPDLLANETCPDLVPWE